MHRLFLVVVSIAFAACTGQSPAATGGTNAATGAAPTGPAATALPTPTAAASTSRPAATLTVFTSPLYGYTVTLPPGWSAGAAILKWDGTAQPAHEEPVNDKFGGPQAATAWAYAGPVSLDLAGYTKDRVAATLRDHGDTCPAGPEVSEPVQIGGQKGTFLAFDCGILINQALTVRDGVGYSFVMRDFSVAAATDATDRALFQQLLDAVVFPD